MCIPPDRRVNQGNSLDSQACQDSRARLTLKATQGSHPRAARLSLQWAELQELPQELQVAECLGSLPAWVPARPAEAPTEVLPA